MEEWRERESREERAVIRLATGTIVVALVGAAVFAGVVIWAIIKLVSAVTS